MKYDYIIIGGGLAGTSLFYRLFKANKKVLLIHNDFKQSASLVAAGLWNPVVLKRFTAVWNALEQINLLKEFYTEQEVLFKTKFLEERPIYRLFANHKEIETWHKKRTTKEYLDIFLNEAIEELKSSFFNKKELGKVTHTGRLHVAKYLTAFHTHFKESILNELFDYAQLKTTVETITYKNIESKAIIFADGYGLKSNPFFCHLPLKGTKGEIIIIKSEELDLEKLIKSGVFVMPEVENTYFIGATYHWADKTWQTTAEAKNELIEKLQKICTAPFKVIHQRAGIRPTVIDRRPIVGTHNKHRNIHILNGLGTRGVMLAPTMSKHLVDHILNGEKIPQEINIQRFIHLEN